MNAYGLLFMAIAAEIIATSALKAADGFTQSGPAIIVIVGYGLAFYLLSMVVKTIPVGIAYAIWSGIGIIGTSVVAFFLYGQKPDTPALMGMFLIITGVLVINLYSVASAR